MQLVPGIGHQVNKQSAVVVEGRQQQQLLHRVPCQFLVFQFVSACRCACRNAETVCQLEHDDQMLLAGVIWQAVFVHPLDEQTQGMQFCIVGDAHDDARPAGALPVNPAL